ncbi:hypothetical protein G6F24_016261 [Rhizopus arrhizus]|nr:hypothetical protein G6F24_016261 [Rhizopus arrhizus]
MAAFQQAMHRTQNELGRVLDDFVVATAQDQAELVAAEPAGQVLLAGHRAQDVAHALQHAVAGLVAMAVIDLLEAVAVDQQQGLRQPFLLGAAFLQVQGQAAAVVQPGQFIGWPARFPDHGCAGAAG